MDNLPLALVQPGRFSPSEYPIKPPFPLEGTDARSPNQKKNAVTSRQRMNTFLLRKQFFPAFQ